MLDARPGVTHSDCQQPGTVSPSHDGYGRGLRDRLWPRGSGMLTRISAPSTPIWRAWPHRRVSIFRRGCAARLARRGEAGVSSGRPASRACPHTAAHSSAGTWCWS